MDVFDLVAKIRLDDSEYEQGVGKAKGTFSNLASGVKNGLATVAKVGAAAVTAGVAGVTALTKMGVEGYAQYEQLVGGVETLFKTSQNTVMRYAENAYKTAGMSANEYMETVTSFSASLIQSLDGDTAKAAEVGNMAITDMSDNANKMGTSMEMIQNAYNGFAKGNYTMLDNLKLGYGGTKEEMKRLLEDAEKISGIKYDLSSFADITEAIHVMQEEMGIAGTTSREAATTIEGSISMMKGAWQNLIVGMADENANMEVLINNFVESAATAAKNLLPRIEQTLSGIGELITAMSPIIAEALPVLVETILPTLITSGISLITALATSIIDALPAIRAALEEGLLIILKEVFGVTEEQAMSFCQGVKDAFDDVVSFLSDCYSGLCGFVDKLVEGWQTAVSWCKEHEDKLISLGIIIASVAAAIGAYNLVQAIKNAGGIAEIAQLAILQVQLWALQAAQVAQTVATTVATAATTAFGAAMTFLTSPITMVILAIGALIAIVVLCVRHWDDIKEAASKAWDWIKGAWESASTWFDTNVIQPIVGFFQGLWDWIKGAASSTWEWIKGVWNSVATWFDTNIIQPVLGFFRSLWDGIQAVWDGICLVVEIAVKLIASILDAAFQLITLPFRFIWENCKEYVFAAWEWIKNAVSTAIEFVSNIITTVFTAIADFFSMIWDGIKSVVGSVWDWITNAVSTAINAVKNVITTVMEAISTFFTNVWNGIKLVFTTVWNAIVDFLKPIIEAIAGFFVERFNTIKENITTVFNAIKTVITTVWNAIKTAVTTVVNAIKEVITSVFNAVKNTVSNIWEGLKNIISNVINSIKNTISNGFNAAKDTVSNILGSIKDKFTSIFDGVKNIVKKAIDAIKGFFKFNVELPNIKLPHFGIKPAGWQIGDLLKGEIPKLDIQWYKKAYDSAMVLSNPTIFGYSNGRLLGGGDGNGNEIVAGESHLMGLIGQTVESKNERIVVLLSALLEAIVGGNAEMVQALMSDRTFTVGEREFARLVKQYA